MKELDEIVFSSDRDTWSIDDWKNWAIYCEENTSNAYDEFFRILKENLQLKNLLERQENYIRSYVGMPKRIKTKGLITAPRGRPLKKLQNEKLIELLKSLRNEKTRWINIGDAIQKFNDVNKTKYPTSERYLRALLKSAK